MSIVSERWNGLICKTKIPSNWLNHTETKTLQRRYWIEQIKKRTCTIPFAFSWCALFITCSPKKWKPQKLGQMQMHAWPHSAMSFSSGSASDASTTECSLQGPNHPLKLQHCSSNSQLPLRGIRNPFASLKTWIGVFLRGRFGCAWCLMWDDWLEKTITWVESPVATCSVEQIRRRHYFGTYGPTAPHVSLVITSL